MGMVVSGRGGGGGEAVAGARQRRGAGGGGGGAGGGGGGAALAGGPDAAVDGDDGAGDVGAAAAAEEDGDAGHVVRAADAAQRGRRRDLVAPGGQGVLHHLGLERTGGDRVDRDVARAELTGQDPGELVQAGLAGRVGVGVERRDLQAVDAAHVDHPGRVVGG